MVVDRNTVPNNLCDISLTFASAVEIPGKVKYIHPSEICFADLVTDTSKLKTLRSSSTTQLCSETLRSNLPS